MDNALDHSIKPTSYSNGNGHSASLRKRPGSSSASAQSLHPLASSETTAQARSSIEATRPNLVRRTTETLEELQRVGRDSLDGGVSGGEIGWSSTLGDRSSLESHLLSKREDISSESSSEKLSNVLIHEVQSTDTLPKLALLYGIDLSLLKKVNKLWSTDSVHLRKTLYIPLEACTLRETLIWGPDEGQVTLFKPSPPSSSLPSLVMSGEANGTDHLEASCPVSNGSFSSINGDHAGGSGAAVAFLGSTNMTYSSSSVPSVTSTMTPHPTSTTLKPSGTNPSRGTERILSVVKLPASELSFFPRSTPASNRSSLDSWTTRLERSAVPPSPLSFGPRKTSNGSKAISTSIPRSRTLPGKTATATTTPPSGSLTSRMTSLFIDPLSAGPVSNHLASVPSAIRSPSRSSSVRHARHSSESRANISHSPFSPPSPTLSTAFRKHQPSEQQQQYEEDQQQSTTASIAVEEAPLELSSLSTLSEETARRTS